DHRDPAIARATTRGRIHEFESFGWRPEDVPDPQDPATLARSRLDWSEPERSPHRELLDWYRRLLRLRRQVPELGPEGPLQVDHDEGSHRLAMTRGLVRVCGDFATGQVSVEWSDGRPIWE